MKKITILTILSLIFLASCGEAKNTLEDTVTNTEIKTNELKNDGPPNMIRRDEVQIERILKLLTFNEDKKVFLDFKGGLITRNELREKIEELKIEKNKNLEEANISLNIELINKITEELSILDSFRL